MFNNKRGESLVEVLVAISVLMVVFGGAVSMIVGSVRLNMSARQRTISIAMVQKKMTEYLAENSGAGFCDIAGLTATPILDENVAGCSTDTSYREPCYWIELAPLDSATEVDSTRGVTDANFIKVISHGRWYLSVADRQDFQISRLLRKK